MPPPRLVTFDCAGTLVELRQPLVATLYDAAATIGIPVTNASAHLFHSMYMARLEEFHEVNLTRDPDLGKAFWIRLASDWLVGIGQDPSQAPSLQEEVERKSFGHSSSMFGVYDDVVPCLDRLQAEGYRLAALSNWDYTLHRVLKTLGIHAYFDAVVASLEEGFEKPDPRIFELTLARCGFSADEALHVGDHPVDDLKGGLGAGMRAILLDRSGSTGDAIHSLDRLEEHPSWTG